MKAGQKAIVMWSPGDLHFRELQFKPFWCATSLHPRAQMRGTSFPLGEVWRSFAPDSSGAKSLSQSN